MTTVWLDVAHGDALAINVAGEQAYKLHLEHNCDLYIVPCDRREMAGVALTLFSQNQVFAQFHAGDICQGNHDEVYGWIITRCATLHFCNSEESARRILRSGEEAWRVHTVGSTALDDVIDPETGEMLLDQSLVPAVPFDLLLIHPDTYSMEDTHRDMMNALTLVDKYTVVIGSNKDPNWEVVDMNVRNFQRIGVKSRFRIPRQNGPFLNYYPEGVPRRQFLALMKDCKRFITNSSSAVNELPAFGISKWVPVGKRNRERRPLDKLHAGGSQRIARIIKHLDLTLEEKRKLLVKRFIY